MSLQQQQESDDNKFAKPFAVPAKPTSTPQQPASEAAPAPAPANIPKLPYEKPSWSAKPTHQYSLEVLKNGASIETIEVPTSKEFATIGRLPLCDILMEHPSISRYHAVIQFDHDGEAYLYDMDSAHGTRLNKKEISKREYQPLKPGDQIRFGESTRICIFNSDKPYDPEQEALERREKALKERIARATRGEPMSASAQQVQDTIDDENEGISWGFGEDAIEDDDDNDDDAEDNDPESNKKYLEETLNMSSASADADLLSVEAQKQAFEDAKRRREDLEIMYGEDSDEELYDKTSRKKSKKKADKALTYDDLVKQQKETEVKLHRIEKELEDKRKREQEDTNNNKDEEEDLDAYMNNLSKKPLKDDKSIFLLQKELAQLKKDNERLIKLVKLTKPSDIL